LGVPGTLQQPASSGGEVPYPPIVETPEEEAISIDPDYSNRQGYNANFLGTGTKRVALPQLSAALKAKAAENSEATGADNYLIPYHHFTIVMNRERKLAFYTAVNIDGKKHFSIKRETDRWIMDPRIDDVFQAGEAVYKNNPLDRGHLVRRLDPAWGSSQTLAKFANDDTFHFTNCSPQHQDFNQGQTLWAGLEDYILNNAKAEDLKVTVFTGPVFATNDRKYRGIKLPKQFWKVVTIVNPDTGKLSATAYLLSQASLISNLEAEVFSYGAYRTFQVRVKKVEDLTGLKFGNLATFDPLNVQEAALVREVNTYEEITF
jgi:endonuclease G